MLIRYLTKEKFEWLLCDNGIYVGSASTQSDQNEGLYDSTIISKLLKSSSTNSSLDWQEIDDISDELMLIKKSKNYLSSWFCGECETQKMWNEYGCDGVALISDEISITQALPEPIGCASSFYKVIYSDAEKAAAIHNPFLFKNENFRHESEFRLVIDIERYSILTGFEKEKFGVVYVGNIPSYESENITNCLSEQGKRQSHHVIKSKSSGYVVSFDLSNLIKEIRLHPNCTKEQADQISKLLYDAGHNILVKRSSLEYST